MKNHLRRTRVFVLPGLLAMLWGGMVGWSQSPASQGGEAANPGQKMLEEAVAALGGNAYLSVRDITINGRGYQLYHESTSGQPYLSITSSILTRSAWRSGRRRKAFSFTTASRDGKSTIAPSAR